MTKRRSKRAAALLTVLVMSAVSMIFLMALATTVTAAIKAASSDKWVEGLRNCAEVGVDYAVDKFNTVYPCPLDPSTSGTLTTILPASELIATPVNGATPNAGTGVSNVTVTIKVTRLKSADWLWLRDNCTVYSPQIDPNNSSSNGWLSPASTNITTSSGGGFRVIESTASNGVISRTVRVILKARFGVQPDGSKPLEVGGTTPTTANYFQQPLFGNVSVELAGGKINGMSDLLNPSTHSANGTTSYNLNVQSNSSASISNGAVLSGDLTIASQGSGSNDVGSASGGIIEGRLIANGSVDNTVVSYQDATNGNVQARAELPDGVYQPTATRNGDNFDFPLVTNGSASQGQISPVATPSQSTGLNDLSSYVGASNSPTNDGSVFQTPVLSTENIANGQFVTFNNSSVPVQIFVDQGSTSPIAVNIDTSKISTNSLNPADFQIWYEGNKPVNVSLTSDFRGLIYAPNAKVTITNSSGSPTFYGAVVGKKLAVNLSSGAQISVATGLSGSGLGGAALKPESYKYSLRPGEGTVIQGWQPITWQEFGTQ